LEQLIIKGGRPLRGNISISGAKNAAVAIIPAALATEGICTVENLPHIEDVIGYTSVLEAIGAKCTFLNKSTLQIDTRGMSESSTTVTHENLKDMRASYYLIGALLGRFKKVSVTMPGGCNFGERPIGLHMKGFEVLGATVVQEHGFIHVYADKLVGGHIYLDVASVGATINIMMAACYAEGTTTIDNAAKEPHIVDCANFLNMCGANIKGAGTEVIRITGVGGLKGCDYTIIPDQIEAGTYMMAAAITRGNVKVNNVIPKHMESLSAKLQEMGCNVTSGDDWIRVDATNKELLSTTVMTQYYPGFPTDLQPQMTTLLTQGNEVSYMHENIFSNRYQYIDQLMRLGAKIKTEGRMAVVQGPSSLTGADVIATDLRAGAALVLAGLAAKGITKISNIQYIDRGYENIEEKLSSLGADIRRVTTDGDEEQAHLEVV